MHPTTALPPAIPNLLPEAVSPEQSLLNAIDPELAGLIAAEQVFKSLRATLAGKNTYAWNKVYNAEEYLQRRVKLYFEAEAA